MKNYLLAILLVLSFAFMSCEPTDINEDTQIAYEDIQATDQGDSTNSGTTTPPRPGPSNEEE